MSHINLEISRENFDLVCDLISHRRKEMMAWAESYRYHDRAALAVEFEDKAARLAALEVALKNAWKPT